MIEIERARELTLRGIEPLPAEDVPLSRSLGRFLAEDVRAADDLPPFTNSAMDGYAVRSTELAGAGCERPVILGLRAAVRAGDAAAAALGSGETVKVMTGAPVPAEADAVVMRESTEETGDGRVRFFHSPGPGENIRPKGEDVRAGDVLLGKGHAMRPWEIALLAAQGITRVPVFRRPRAAILATGDELVEASAPLAPGKIRNSTSVAAAAALARWGAEPLDLGIVRDDPDELLAALKGALERADMLLVTGGVSVGDYDFTGKALKELGFEPVFWKVAQKPGKPLLNGLCRGKPVFGLPGNPVSVLVCLEEYVRPALQKLQGHDPGPRYHLRGTVKNRHKLPGGRRQFVFCVAREDEDGFALEIVQPQASHTMGRICRANALALSPVKGPGFIEEGQVLPFRWLE